MEGVPPELAEQFERLRGRLSAEQWQRRLDKACERERIVVAVEQQIEAGVRVSKAVGSVAPRVTVRTVQRWRRRYGRHGWWGLVDGRLGPKACIPKQQRLVIEAMRRANAGCHVDTIHEELARQFDVPMGRTSIRKVLKQAGLNNPPGRVPGTIATGERLEMAGLEFIKAACLETGYLSTMTGAVKQHVASLPQVQQAAEEPDGVRDDRGRFVPAYNGARQGEVPEISPAFASVEVKRSGKDFTRMKIAQVRSAVLERKLLVMLVLPVLGEGRWDGLTDPRGNYLEGICGYGYMPATLDKFSRELKYAGVSPTLMEQHARLWYEHTAQWTGDALRAAVIYVDATAKPLWTSKFALSGKVSSVGRTMPCLDRIVIHTGYGVPLWIKTFSGRAGIHKHVLSMVEQMEAAIGQGMVGRITVIDAEMDSVRLFKQFDQAQRGFVTILKGSMLQGDKRIFNQTNFRSYRQGDRIKEGRLDLNDPDGGKYRIRVVLVQRRTKGTVTVLATNLGVNVDLPLKTAQVAQLYFGRWTHQEHRFRDYNAGLHFDNNYGYGKQLVVLPPISGETIWSFRSHVC